MTTSLTEIRRLSDRIAREFDPDRIVLFGSHAYGSPRDDSDIDILVILPFTGKGLHKAVEILDRVNPSFPIDLLARRPEDVASRYADGDPLIREAIDRGTTLYERHG